MSLHASLDIFSSLLSLEESSSPYEEALEMISQLDEIKGGTELKVLREELLDQKKMLEELQARIEKIGNGSMRVRLNDGHQYFRDGLSRDAERLGADFKKAAEKFPLTLTLRNIYVG